MPTNCSKDQFNANAHKYAVSDVHRAGLSLPVLLNFTEPVKDDQLLDVATGTGHTALTMAPFVARAIGIDLAPKMLEQARRLAIEQGASNCDFVEGSAEKIPFEDGQFTLVTARHALALEFVGTGRVLAFQEPMLVVRLEHLSDDGASSVR